MHSADATMGNVQAVLGRDKVNTFRCWDDSYHYNIALPWKQPAQIMTADI